MPNFEMDGPPLRQAGATAGLVGSHEIAGAARSLEQEHDLVGAARLDGLLSAAALPNMLFSYASTLNNATYQMSRIGEKLNQTANVVGGADQSSADLFRALTPVTTGPRPS